MYLQTTRRPKSKKKLFIALEAIDGVGKSTVINLLKQNSKIVTLATPPKPFALIRKIFDYTGLKLRFIFYLSSVIYASYLIKKWVKEKPVICDRYLLSTLAAHEARGLSENWFNSLGLIIKNVYPPDFVILLYCKENIRLQRLKKRKLTKSDIENLNKGLCPKIYIGYQKWAKKLGYNLIKIDTTNLTPGQIRDKIMEVIMKNQYSKAKK
ncbi:MAG: hypothetical protein COU82_00910 [Candidatus Portnoybacteria bacterium CG10_big_fil_rev_8_21_14_0_10_38_18]|uniref:Thymidylate kinase n=1 Tax=Candidatus Portnoybacteria bacterium CG10_big_fil_rev_8_21_14_0_10_38_18 TaxID=1974813 RepID=A0A2M8KCI4_9BACT|nr:MAG: hypothetical protein COU82_00910 [Candidatus Portnoybacteria bacterium CG10_big_fil_rev_8_21_14_0_10_38_18]